MNSHSDNFMSPTELHASATQFWHGLLKADQKRWRTAGRDAFIEYVIKTVHRGWSFMNIGLEAHNEHVARDRAVLQSWNFPPP